MKKIAIIGAGISGVSAAYYLNKLGHEVFLFESGDYFGGHTNTIEVTIDGIKMPVDTGFLVHNNRTYPNLIDFFKELGIQTHLSEMSFSVVRLSENIMWAGTNLMTVFAQYKNLFNPRFYKFLREVLRFNKESQAYLRESKEKLDMTLGELLKLHRYSLDFQNWYLLPMGGCIWSSPTEEMLDFPAYSFLTFCTNHGLLQISDRPQWKTVQNGCHSYVKKALLDIKHKYTGEAVRSISKENGKIKVVTTTKEDVFDYCFICTHPPETLKMLKLDDEVITKCLTPFHYQANEAVVHFDESVLPAKKMAWSAWNYLSVKSSDTRDAVSVSYLINKLQPLPTTKPVIVTLNPVSKIAEEKIFKTIQYEHPLFTSEAVRAQKEVKAIQGRDGLYFSGAWMRYGFHEDGILSTKEAIQNFLHDTGENPELIKIL